MLAVFGKWMVLFHVQFHHKKKKKRFIAGWGFCGPSGGHVASSLLGPHGRRLKVVGVNWEEVQEQREHSVPFLHIGAEKKRLSTPSAFAHRC